MGKEASRELVVEANVVDSREYETRVWTSSVERQSEAGNGK
jgi:hypothetical protein